MDHAKPYSDDYLQGILKSVKTIAMIGASPIDTVGNSQKPGINQG